MMTQEHAIMVKGEDIPEQVGPYTPTNAREVSEVQSALVIAKKFPRDQKAALDRIKVACQRPTLARQAVYQYARGGTNITGPSIRLAEAIAQNWGNIQYGIRELDQVDGESIVEAFAWDVETNTRATKTFRVPHLRAVKNKQTGKRENYRLEDPRDIYEMVANQGARRMRACILGVIPGDVTEEAVAECERTLSANVVINPENLARILKCFEDVGVSKSQIEKKIQRHIDAITPAQVVSLGNILNSLRDGMSRPEDWFEPEAKAGDHPADKPAKKAKLGDMVPPVAAPAKPAATTATMPPKPSIFGGEEDNLKF